MKLRSTILTVLAFFALMSGALVQAQDDMGLDIDPCFGLAEADCTVINEASANGIGDATSFTVDVSIDFSGSELSELFGAFAMFGGEMDMGALSEINDVTFVFDGTFDVAMDEESETGSIAGSFTMSFSQNDGEVTEMAMDVILLEDMAYFNEGDGWQSIDLTRLEESDALAGLEDMASGFGMDMGMMDMGDEDDMDDEDAMDMMGGMFSEDSLGALLGLLDLPGFVVYERSGDDFAFDVDFTALQVLLTDEYEDVYTEIVTSAAEVDPIMAFLIPSLLTIFEEGTISIVQTVDTDANIVSAIDLDVNLSLSLALLTGEANTSDILLGTTIALSNLDDVTMTEAPADAVDATDEVIAWLEEMVAEAEMEAED